MIPRLRPTLGWSEALSLLRWWEEGVSRFEERFAETMGTKHAVSFSYGRAGLLKLLQTLKIHSKEILMPAYSCVVVSHAIVHSGNRPRFVDVSTDDFNMDPDQVLSALSGETGAVIATNMYGHPLDLQLVRELKRRKVPVIQDCALAWGSTWQGQPVADEGIAAFYSFNLGKPLCTLYGGMVTTNDTSLYRGLLEKRNRNRPGFRQTFRRFCLFAAQSIAFRPIGFEITDWLANHTAWLNGWLDYYDPARLNHPKSVFQ